MAEGDVLSIVDGHQAFAAPSGGVPDPIVVPVNIASGGPTGTDAAGLTIAPDTADPGDQAIALRVSSPTDETGFAAAEIEVDNDNGHTTVFAKLQAYGAGTGALILRNTAPGDTGQTLVQNDGRIALVTEGGVSPFNAYQAGTPYGLLFAILGGGQLVTGATSAPADGDLEAGNLAIWFDATNGAAKLMIKAKQANGTVVTGSVNLA